jgi:hypothetical protein
MNVPTQNSDVTEIKETPNLPGKGRHEEGCPQSLPRGHDHCYYVENDPVMDEEEFASFLRDCGMDPSRER